MLVDTGYEHDAHSIVSYLWSIGRTPMDITDIALTHSHRSHLGGVAALKRLESAADDPHPPWEADICAGQRMAQPMPFRPICSRSSHLPDADRGADRLRRARTGASRTSCSPTCEGQRIGPLEVILTPGHTPGSV